MLYFGISEMRPLTEPAFPRIGGYLFVPLKAC